MHEKSPSEHAVAREKLSGAMWRLTGICALVYFLDGLVHSVMGPLAPDVAIALSLTPAELGPIFSANLIGQCIGLIGVPLIASRCGHRLIVITTLVGFGVAQGLTALADSGTSLFVFRLVTGIFLGGCLPSCLAMVTAGAPVARRGLAIMVLFTGYGLGATVAGVLPPLFARFGGWEATMACIGVVCLLSAVAAWLWLAEVHAPTEPEQAEAVDQASLTMAIFSPRYLVGTLGLWLLFVAMLTISYCLNSWLPTILVEVGRDRSIAAISVSIFSFGGIAAALGIGLLIDRFGATLVLVTALCASTILLFIVGQVLASASTGLLLTLLGLAGFFVLGTYGGINVVLANYYPYQLRAIGIGWAKSVGRVGTVVAPIFIGLGLSRGMAETTIMSLFALPAALAVLALLAVVAWERRSRVLLSAAE